MQNRRCVSRLPGSRRARALVGVTVVTGLLAAGCGGSSPRTTAATVTTAASVTTAAVSSRSTTTATVASSSSGPSAGHPGLLGFAECMRANGVPTFPDPKPGRGALFAIPSGTSPAAPAFRAAEAKCQKLLGGGFPSPGAATHPSAQTLAKLLRISICMRQHGISQFPDPTTTRPVNPTGVGVITDFDGAILLFPATINLQSPAYRQALAACGAPPLGLPH
jgi:hypothetical protein